MALRASSAWRADARILQERLRARVRIQSLGFHPQRLAGVDVHFDRAGNRAWGAVCVVDAADLEVLECQVAAAAVEVPYQPGYLSFRELPAVKAALEQLAVPPDLLLLDGQGIAHPRRFGLACHAGVELELPAIGCAKSRLCGTFAEPPRDALSQTDLHDRGELVGRVLRSRSAVRPLFVSVGHRITLEEAVAVVISCLDGYRIPRPLRLAHQRARAAAQGNG